MTGAAWSFWLCVGLCSFSDLFLRLSMALSFRCDSLTPYHFILFGIQSFLHDSVVTSKLFSTLTEIASIQCNLGLKSKACNLSSTLLKNIRHQPLCSSNASPYMVTCRVWYLRINSIWIPIQCTQHIEYYLIFPMLCDWILRWWKWNSRTALHCFALLSCFVFPCLVWGLSTCYLPTMAKKNFVLLLCCPWEKNDFM